MIPPKRILNSLLPISLVCLACRSAPGNSTAASDGPHIEFAISLLAEDSSQTLDSVWSQNDAADTVWILISGANGLILSSVSIDLIAEHQAEGDPIHPPAPAPQVISWATFKDVRVDSLPAESRGRLLVAVRPSALQEQAQTQAGDLWATTINVRVQLGSIVLTRSIDLLWD